MSLENWLIETVLTDKPHIPGSALQFLLNQYMSFYSQKERLFNTKFNPAPSETEEIATRNRELMEDHYNLPLGVFENFLGKTMKYSAALWETGATTLDEAQQIMMDGLCQKIESFCTGSLPAARGGVIHLTLRCPIPSSHFRAFPPEDIPTTSFPAIFPPPPRGCHNAFSICPTGNR